MLAENTILQTPRQYFIEIIHVCFLMMKSLILRVPRIIMVHEGKQYGSKCY